MAERFRCSPAACAYSLRLHSAQIWYERTRLGLGRSRDDCQIGPPFTLVFCPSRFRTVAGAGLRSVLSTSTPPRGRRLLDLIAQSPMAKSLVYSYICAEQRKDQVRVLAQILSPLTAGYSLRIFDECFEFSVG